MEKIAMDMGATLPLRYPKTKICATYDDMSRESAEQIAATLSEKPNALICLPAGSSAVRTFQLLVEMKNAGAMDFSKARFVQLDEWLDIEDEEQNCSSFLQRHFYGPAGILPKQINSFDVHAADLEAECRRMDRYIADNGPIDFMLLGLGMNGHLGLNEPGLSWDHYTVVVELSEITMTVGQKYFEKGQRLTRGITLGMHHMFDAKKVVLQVGESKKADIVEALYATEPNISLPGTAMKLLKNGLILLDEDAAAKLDHAKVAVLGAL